MILHPYIFLFAVRDRTYLATFTFIPKGGQTTLNLWLNIVERSNVCEGTKSLFSGMHAQS
jgi:hypothetical protein